MMDESKLCDNIRDSLKAKGIDLSERDLNNLYASVMTNLYTMLDEDKTINISDFGSFWRKKAEPAAVTFFKPIDRLLERLNTRKR